MGYGYPGYVAGRLGLEEPGKYCFINRGVGGNRITDVYARIKQDIINLKPDVMSLLIGVNDVWHEYLNQNGVSTAKFEMIYRLLLDEILSELPDTKIILLEPFVVKGEGTEDNYDEFRTGVEEKATVVRKLAKDYNLPFIPLQADLNKLTEVTPADYWLLDGVHPTIYFHQFIADKWIDTFHKLN